MMISMETQTTTNTPIQTAPGPLKSETTLTLHTLYAWQLVHGRAGSADQPSIIGLLSFASMLKPIWHSARSEAPAAVKSLTNIDKELQIAQRRLRSIRMELDSLAEATLGIGYSMPVSAKPVSISLEFLVPQAYQAARLLAQFDEIMCWRSVLLRSQAMTAGRSHELMRHSGRTMRRLLASADRLGASATQNESNTAVSAANVVANVGQVVSPVTNSSAAS